MFEKINNVCCKNLHWAEERKNFPLIVNKKQNCYSILHTNTTESILFFYCPWCGGKLNKENLSTITTSIKQNPPLINGLVFYPQKITPEILDYPIWLNKKWIGDEIVFDLYLVDE